MLLNYFTKFWWLIIASFLFFGQEEKSFRMQ